MAVKALELKSGKTTAEIEAGDGTLDIQLPLTLEGWSLTEMIRDHGRDVVVQSADGAHFIGVVQDVDEARYVITVELN
jgi:hypothetical protein